MFYLEKVSINFTQVSSSVVIIFCFQKRGSYLLLFRRYCIEGFCTVKRGNIQKP